VAGQDVRVLPRPTRVAVALGAGGARGYAHIGVLEVLEERGYDVISIAGSSMGALVGGLYAAGGMRSYADWVSRLTHRDVLRLYDLAARGPGAIRGERVFARVRDILGDVRIEDLPIDFTAVATDLGTGEERWLQDGPLVAAIRASVALPGFLSPVVVQGQLLADGGLLAPLPIAPTLSARADVTVAVAVSGRQRSAAVAPARSRRTLRRGGAPPGSPTGGPGTEGAADEATEPVLAAPPAGLRLVDVVGLSLEAVRAGVVRHSLAAHPPDVLVTVPRSACRTLDFHKAADLIALGRRLAVEALDRAEAPATSRVVDG
jgi:NTE family protein